jgi:hypothetical protein
MIVPFKFPPPPREYEYLKHFLAPYWQTKRLLILRSIRSLAHA